MKSTISFGFFYPIPKPQIHTTSLLIILSSPIWISYVNLPFVTISILQCCRPKVTGSFVLGRQQCRSPFPPSHQVKESKIVRDLIDFGPCDRFLLLITLLITACILFCTLKCHDVTRLILYRLRYWKIQLEANLERFVHCVGSNPIHRK